MIKHNREGAVGALLDEYGKAILELKSVIVDITTEQLIKIVDNATHDENSGSIQNVLSHVISCGYSYANYIRNLKCIQATSEGKIYYPAIQQYCFALDDMYNYTCDTFLTISDDELERFEHIEKLHTAWGQVYDIEQMMEHAIVHILRHRRQLQKIIKSI